MIERGSTPGAKIDTICQEHDLRSRRRRPRRTFSIGTADGRVVIFHTGSEVFVALGAVADARGKTCKRTGCWHAPRRRGGKRTPAAFQPRLGKCYKHAAGVMLFRKAIHSPNRSPAGSSLSSRPLSFWSPGRCRQSMPGGGRLTVKLEAGRRVGLVFFPRAPMAPRKHFEFDQARQVRLGPFATVQMRRSNKIAPSARCKPINLSGARSAGSRRKSFLTTLAKKGLVRGGSHPAAAEGSGVAREQFHRRNPRRRCSGRSCCR